MAARLASSYDTHVVSVLGFAGSPAPTEQLSIKAIVRDLEEYLAGRGLDDVTLVGHSVGGMVAMQTALGSERIERLVLVDSLPFTAGLFMPGTTPEMATQSAELLRARMKSMPRDSFVAQQRIGLKNLSAVPSFVETLAHWSGTSDQSAVADVLCDLLAVDLRDDLESIPASIDVIAAWESAMPVGRDAVASMYESQYAGHDDTVVTVVEGARHFIMVDQPAAFQSALLAALQR